MGGLLTVGQLAALFAISGFALGVLLAQRLKDWWNRVPASLRSEMSALETAMQAKMTAELHSAMQNVHAAAGLQLQKAPPPPSPVVVPPSQPGA